MNKKPKQERTKALELTHVVQVRDTFVGMRGYPVEHCITTLQQEADTWFKQWKAEYSVAAGYEGYKVERVTVQPGEFLPLILN